jgi:hypothetical protein
MRNLTKSTLSAGLAMSLLGVQTLVGMVRSRRPGEPDRASDALDAVTREAINRCGDTVRETFHAGDKVQRELVDLAFGMFTLAPFRDGRGSQRMSGVTGQAADHLRNWLRSMNPSCSCPGNQSARQWTRWQDSPPESAGSRDHTRDDTSGSDPGWGSRTPGA